MRITLHSIGKTKNPHYAALEDEYARRLQGYHQLERRYYKNEAEMERAFSGNAISGAIILMDEHGSLMNSREFSSQMESIGQEYGQLHCIIGDAEGLPAFVRDIATDIIALSEMTYPHECARVLLLEQLYRAATIRAGHPYHK